MIACITTQWASVRLMKFFKRNVWMKPLFYKLPDVCLSAPVCRTLQEYVQVISINVLLMRNVWRRGFRAERLPVGQSPERAGLNLHQRPLGFSAQSWEVWPRPASSLNTDHGLPAFLTCRNLSMELPITAYGNNASWAVLVFVLCNFAIDV